MAADATIAAAAKSRRKKSRRGVFGVETTFRPAFIIGSIGSGAGSETTAFTDPIGLRETASTGGFLTGSKASRLRHEMRFGGTGQSAHARAPLLHPGARVLGTRTARPFSLDAMSAGDPLGDALTLSLIHI